MIEKFKFRNTLCHEKCSFLGYLLRREYRQFLTDVLGRPISPVSRVRFPETSVRNYHYSLRNNREKRSSHLRCHGSLKPQKSAADSVQFVIGEKYYTVIVQLHNQDRKLFYVYISTYTYILCIIPL